MSVSSNEAQDIISGVHGDPFSLLGMHERDGRLTVCAFHPEAERVEVLDAKSGRRITALEPVPNAPGLFCGPVGRRKARFDYRLRMQRGDASWTIDDPYRFGPVLGELDEYLIGEGAHRRLWDVLGRSYHQARGHRRHPFCSLGAKRQPSVRGRRFQRLGWQAASYAPEGPVGCMGNIHTRYR